MTDPPHAYLLADGRGTRLRSLTDDTPKPLLPFLSVPILHGWLRRLAFASTSHVHLLVGPDPAPFSYLTRDGSKLGLNVSIHTEPSPLGSGGALRAAPQGGGEVLVISADVVTGASLSTLLDHHRRSEAEACCPPTTPHRTTTASSRPSATATFSSLRNPRPPRDRRGSTPGSTSSPHACSSNCHPPIRVTSKPRSFRGW